MNEGEKREIKTEMYSKHFLKFCRDQSTKNQVPEWRKSDFLAECIVRMSAIANRVERKGLKP
jgi:hypothetical protein